ESLGVVEPAGSTDAQGSGRSSSATDLLDGGEDGGALDGCGGGDGGHGSSRQVISTRVPSETWAVISRPSSSSPVPPCQVTVRRPVRPVAGTGSWTGCGSGAGPV